VKAAKSSTILEGHQKSMAKISIDGDQVFRSSGFFEVSILLHSTVGQTIIQILLLEWPILERSLFWGIKDGNSTILA